MDNYEALLEIWEQPLKENLDFDTKSRIENCKNQMKLFKFYLGLNLSQRLYPITINLSKTLQQVMLTKMFALRGNELADLTVQTLENMRNEHDFSLLHKNIKVLASKVEAISSPTIPVKQRRPNYSVMHYITGNPKATAAAYYLENPHEHYKLVYYVALDSIVNAIKDGFGQPTSKLFTQAEQLFLKTVGKQDATNELKVLEPHFKGDYDTASLTSELQLLPTIFECEPMNLEEAVRVLKSLS